MARKTTQNEDWALDEAEARPPVRGRRTVVSVAFPSEDFQAVSKTAEAFDMKVSEFIREAALERTRQRNSSPTTVIAGVSTGFVVEGRIAPVTRLAGLVALTEEKSAVPV